MGKGQQGSRKRVGVPKGSVRRPLLLTAHGALLAPSPRRWLWGRHGAILAVLCGVAALAAACGGEEEREREAGTSPPSVVEPEAGEDAAGPRAEVGREGGLEEDATDDHAADTAPPACRTTDHGDPSVRAGSICAGMLFDRVQLVSQQGYNWADSWMMSWGGDDKTYTNFSDGRFIEDAEPRPKYSNALLTIEQDPPFLAPTAFKRLSADPLRIGGTWAHYLISTLVIGDTLYAGVVGFNGEAGIARASETLGSLTYERSAPMWAPAGARPFVYPSFLQNGRGYAGNRDGFVYVFGSDGRWGSCGTDRNTLRLARVPRTADLLDVRSYEYFDGAGWSADYGRGAEMVADGGNTGGMQSIVSNPVLGRYFLITFGNTCAPNARMVVYDAPEPWGPWSRCGVIFKGEAIWEKRQLLHAVYNPSFNAKWIDAEGAMWISYSSLLPGADAWPSDYAFNLGQIAIQRRGACQ
jgi:hypothetical protein